MKKPMLLSNDDFDLEQIDYTNMFESIKRDGIRAEVSNTGILGRSFKAIRNVNIQNWFREVFKEIPPGFILEAEIYAHGLPCRKIAGICDSKDKDVPTNMKLYIFGVFDENKTFEERIKLIKQLTFCKIKSDRYEVVEQVKVNSFEEAQEFYEKALDQGYEGAVLMDGSKKYKQNRVRIKEHIGFKLKPHKETDLLIIGVTERMKNTNEKETNELGNSFRRNTVDAKESTGIAGTFICDCGNGITTDVTINGDEAYRKEIWKNKDDYKGQYAVVKSMAYGEKDKPRHGRLIGIKYSIEK